MRLQSLAGHGSSAAFVSAGAVAALFVIEQPGFWSGYVPFALATFLGYFLALGLWLGALNIMLFDLERREPPASDARVLRVARVLALVAIVTSALLLIAVLTGTNSRFQGLYGLMFLAVGAVLFASNIEARQARMLWGALPWFGMASGVVYLVVALGHVAYYFAPVPAANVLIGLPLGVIVVANSPVLIDVNPLDIGQLLYVIWAIWLGVALSRAEAVAPAPAS